MRCISAMSIPLTTSFFFRFPPEDVSETIDSRDSDIAPLDPTGYTMCGPGGGFVSGHASSSSVSGSASSVAAALGACWRLGVNRMRIALSLCASGRGGEPEPDASGGVCTCEAEREVGPDHRDGTDAVPGALVNSGGRTGDLDFPRDRTLSRWIVVRGGGVASSMPLLGLL